VQKIWGINHIMEQKAHIIVVGNEKGGAGKTTTSIHLIVYLLSLGFKVGTMDVDSRQRSLTRYIENRIKTRDTKSAKILVPEHIVLAESTLPHIEEKNNAETKSFTFNLERLQKEYDFVVVDTPGSNTHLSRVAHSFADTVVTPINDSFLDLDVIARFESADNLGSVRPSHYSEVIWQQKMQRAKRDRSEINWIVLRNRLSFVDAKNKRNMSIALEKIAHRLGFRTCEGFSERVIFRELFLQGLTLLDFDNTDLDFSMSVSHVAARQELRNFLKTLNIKKIDEALETRKTAPVAVEEIEEVWS